MKCLGKGEWVGTEPEKWRGEIKRLPVFFSRPSGPQRLSATAARPDKSMKERQLQNKIIITINPHCITSGCWSHFQSHGFVIVDVSWLVRTYHVIKDLPVYYSKIELNISVGCIYTARFCLLNYLRISEDLKMYKTKFSLSSCMLYLNYELIEL